MDLLFNFNFLNLKFSVANIKGFIRCCCIKICFLKLQLQGHCAGKLQIGKKIYGLLVFVGPKSVEKSA